MEGSSPHHSCRTRGVSRRERRPLAHHYYISSLCSDDAELFARGIRGHWSIENRLHWVKDVIQHEDGSGIKKGNGIETLSILKNVAINISRELGFDSIKGATIHFASNVKELCEYFRT
jgi:predicted transposase YbfD/YdcC